MRGRRLVTAINDKKRDEPVFTWEVYIGHVADFGVPVERVFVGAEAEARDVFAGSRSGISEGRLRWVTLQARSRTYGIHCQSFATEQDP